MYIYHLSFKKKMENKQQSKRKSANEFITQLSLTKYVKGQKEYHFYIALTKPNIELIWCEEYPGQDAYTHPMYDQILNRTKWMSDNHFIGFFSRRTSKSTNTILYNEAAAKPGQTIYPRRYYLRIVDSNESTIQSRHAVLKECVEVSLYIVVFIYVHLVIKCLLSKLLFFS